MDFELNQDQLAYIETAKHFAEKELAPNAAKWDAESIFDKSVYKKAGELGFCGLYSSEEYGGLNLSRLDSSLIFEELSKACTSTTAFLTIHNMASWMIDTWGQTPVKEAWCPELLSGEKLASYCLTEPNAGSDAASIKTTARKEGSNYIINGEKAFISGAGSTDVLVLMARCCDLNGKAITGAKGISSFVVPSDLPGIKFGRNEDKMGWRSQPTRIITFNDVKIPVINRLGSEGDGFKIAMKGLDGGRINIASCSLGTAFASILFARNYLLERKQFGKTLGSFQGLQFKLADMATELEAARALVRFAAAKLDNNDINKTSYSAMAKRFATDTGFKICNDALQILGGYGYIKEYPIERHVRDTRVHQILEGTNEIMRVIIARKLLSDTNTIL